jgi:hypothetical protein
MYHWTIFELPKLLFNFMIKELKLWSTIFERLRPLVSVCVNIKKNLIMFKEEFFKLYVVNFGEETETLVHNELISVFLYIV